ncbi:5209_t:CDS:1, partial [Dentiscutata erythropus]
AWNAPQDACPHNNSESLCPENHSNGFQTVTLDESHVSTVLTIVKSVA